MGLNLKDAFYFAIDNIAKYSDTDVFPFPIENNILYDKRECAIKLMEEIHNNFDSYITTVPPVFENMLGSAGYTGFRWLTQIDPIWNAYFLGLVLSIAEEIEKSRLSKNSNSIFAYRIALDKTQKTIFDVNYGWRTFNETSLELAKSSEYKYVLICDISNFYQNIYHHRIENSLAKLSVDNKSIEKNIMSFLQRFSNTKSYGLPIGGQGARILAELLLNRTDRLLHSKEIRFCRFVDDYHVFARNEEEVYSHLLYLSQILIENEGLSLQKSKTRIVSTDEFIATSYFNINEGSQSKSIFAISLKYDPYSLTADEDYEKLKEEVSKLEILDALSQELTKTRIHTSLMKKMLSTLKYLDKKSLETAIMTLLDNIETLAPVFPNLMILFENTYEDLSKDVQNKIIEKLCSLISASSYLLKIDLNASYAIRVLSKQYSEENEISVLKIFDRTESHLIKRDIILIMAKWNATHWISDLRNRYYNLTTLEKRSFLLASYSLGDEGRHWREHTKSQFSAIDVLYRDWICGKDFTKWSLPI